MTPTETSLQKDDQVRAIVLAAGFGTRLRPLTEWIPKPLMPLGNVPLLGHILTSIVEAGVSDIAVNAHHLANQIIDFVRQPVYADMVTPFPETEILGTGGPIVNAKAFLSQADHFVLHNGDILTNLDVAQVIDAHRSGGQDVTMVVLDGPENKLDVGVGPDGRPVVNDILGKLGRGQEGDRKMTYSGISVFSRKIFEYLPDQPEFCSIITAILKVMETNPHAVAAFAPEDFVWNDLGTVEAFLNCNADAARASVLRPSAARNEFQFNQIAEQGSNRAFYRIKANGNTRILMKSSEEDADFERFIDFGHLFAVHDLPTPTLDGWNPDNHTVLMEDLGETTLHDFVHSGPSSIRMKLVYGNVVETLLDYQLRAGDALSKSGLEVRTFDYDYLLWETEYFRTRFLKECLGFSAEALEPLTGEFQLLAREALALPQLFQHRDFQSQNVMVMGDCVRFVDFQGGRWGPYTYDLASVLLDPYVDLPAVLIESLVSLYRRRIVGSGAVSMNPADFGEHFRIAALQRLMQALGAYGYLSCVKGKERYRAYAAPALKRLLGQLSGWSKYPNLKRIVSRAIDAEKGKGDPNDLLAPPS